MIVIFGIFLLTLLVITAITTVEMRLALNASF